MSDKPSSIRNLGPASDEFYARAKITRAQQMRDLGPDEAYYRALAAGGKPISSDSTSWLWDCWDGRGMTVKARKKRR